MSQKHKFSLFRKHPKALTVSRKLFRLPPPPLVSAEAGNTQRGYFQPQEKNYFYPPLLAIDVFGNSGSLGSGFPCFENKYNVVKRENLRYRYGGENCCIQFTKKTRVFPLVVSRPKKVKGVRK